MTAAGYFWIASSRLVFKLSEDAGALVHCVQAPSLGVADLSMTLHGQ